MAVALKVPFDKKKLALTRAKLRAWWEGAAYDEAAALAAYEAKLAEAAAKAANDKIAVADEGDLFDYEMPARLRALAVLWGQGRIRPGAEAAEAQAVARLGLAPEGVLAMLSPGLIGPLAAVAAAHPGPIEVFEWREETFEALQHGLREAKLGERVKLSRIDLEAHAFAPDHFDGLLSADDFAYSGYPPHLAQQMWKCLKPGARAVVDAYVGAPSPALATAFASSFAEPQIRPREDLLRFFVEASLTVEADEDLTEDFLALARGGFKQLSESLAETGNLDVLAARELAWEAEAWRTRMKLLALKRLERRRFVLVKPADQAENTNAPAE